MPTRRVACRECPHHRLDCFRAMNADEIAFMEDFKRGELIVDAGTPILGEGANSPSLYTVLTGWAVRYKTLEDGRRQVMNYAMPGDLIGLQASLFDAMGHAVEALTPMLLCVFPRENVWTLYERFPSLGFDVTWLASREERLLEENLLTVGRRSARERIAYALWHLFGRGSALGLVKNGELDFPVTQALLADTLGLSLVHTNKTLARLRGEGHVDWRGRRLRIPDPDALADIARARAGKPLKRPFL